MSAREELLCAARKQLWRAWSTSSEELGSAAVETLMGLGMLVPEGGAQELERLRARVAELETARERLAATMQRGQHWRDGRLVSERTLSQREIRHLAGIPLRESAEDEYRHCGADLGRTEFPFTCYRRVAHEGPCSPQPDPGFFTEAELADSARTAAAPVEDPHDSPLHHTYRTGRDLPEYPHA